MWDGYYILYICIHTKIKLENTTTKSWWNEHIIGDIIHDREACGYDEFINQNKDDERDVKK